MDWKEEFKNSVRKSLVDGNALLDEILEKEEKRRKAQNERAGAVFSLVKALNYASKQRLERKLQDHEPVDAQEYLDKDWVPASVKRAATKSGIPKHNKQGRTASRGARRRSFASQESEWHNVYRYSVIDGRSPAIVENLSIDDLMKVLREDKKNVLFCVELGIRYARNHRVQRALNYLVKGIQYGYVNAKSVSLNEKYYKQVQNRKKKNSRRNRDQEAAYERDMAMYEIFHQVCRGLHAAFELHFSAGISKNESRYNSKHFAEGADHLAKWLDLKKWAEEQVMEAHNTLDLLWTQPFSLEEETQDIVNTDSLGPAGDLHIKVLEFLVERHESDDRFLNALGKLYTNARRFDKAFQTLQRCKQVPIVVLPGEKEIDLNVPEDHSYDRLGDVPQTAKRKQRLRQLGERLILCAREEDKQRLQASHGAKEDVNLTVSHMMKRFTRPPTRERVNPSHASESKTEEELLERQGNQAGLFQAEVESCLARGQFTSEIEHEARLLHEKQPMLNPDIPSWTLDRNTQLTPILNRTKTPQNMSHIGQLAALNFF